MGLLVAVVVVLHIHIYRFYMLDYIRLRLDSQLLRNTNIHNSE